jgi:hypothetical protein
MFIFFCCIEFIFVAQKFIATVKIEDGIIEIVSYWFLRKKVQQFFLQSILFEIRKCSAFRSGIYYKLQISQNNRIIIVIDTRDGFEEKDFHLMKEFAEKFL